MSKYLVAKQEARKTLDNKLAEMGFRRQRKEVYFLDISKEACGQLWLNEVSYAGVCITVFPIIGIRHEKIESEVVRFSGLSRKCFSSATIQKGLGYLMPEENYKNWEFSHETDISQVADDMCLAISTYGIPFISANVSLEQVCKKLEENYCLLPTMVFRLPVAYLLLGQLTKAERCLKKFVKEESEFGDPKSYNKFARALRKEMLFRRKQVEMKRPFEPGKEAIS